MKKIFSQLFYVSNREHASYPLNSALYPQKCTHQPNLGE